MQNSLASSTQLQVSTSSGISINCLPRGIAVDNGGNLYLAANSAACRLSPSGVLSVLAGNVQTGASNGAGLTASFNDASAIAVSGSGNIYVADWGNSLIRVISFP